jgi:hypothetical protein
MMVNPIQTQSNEELMVAYGLKAGNQKSQSATAQNSTAEFLHSDYSSVSVQIIAWKQNNIALNAWRSGSIVSKLPLIQAVMAPDKSSGVKVQLADKSHAREVSEMIFNQGLRNIEVGNVS